MFGSTWTIGKRLYSGFGGLLAVVLVLGAFGTWSTSGSMTQFRKAMDGPVAEQKVRPDGGDAGLPALRQREGDDPCRAERRPEVLRRVVEGCGGE